MSGTIVYTRLRAALDKHLPSWLSESSRGRLALLAYGCPIQAIVVALGLDERTVQACALPRPVLVCVDG